jgi:hypothetical protein
MRSVEEALPRLLAAAGAAISMMRCISGDILERAERGEAAATPGNSLALEAQVGEPTARKERSPIKESKGRPVKLMEEGGGGQRVKVKDLAHAADVRFLKGRFKWQCGKRGGGRRTLGIDG